MVKWMKDEGYSWCETARFGDMAVVIVPPEFSGKDWGYQAFDESNEVAMRYGECESEDYGFGSHDDVVAFVEDVMEDGR